MSAPAADTAEKGNAYLEQLKQAAEAQMRRPAPPLRAAKKQKKDKAAADVAANDGSTSDDAGNGDAAVAAAERVRRYSYAAVDAVLRGCPGFLGMCDFKRSNSATKEVLDILRAVLPGNSKLQLVKVGCRGLVVIILEEQQQQQQQQQAKEDEQQPDQRQQEQQQSDQQQPEQQVQAAVQPAAVVADILARMGAGSIPRPRFCQRIAPVETTCAMAASALEAAVKRVMASYIAAHCSSGNKPPPPPQQQQQGPVQFAVLFKNRDSTAPPQQKLAPAGQAKQDKQEQSGSEPGAAAATAVVQQQEPPASERIDKSGAINVAVAAVHECCQGIGGAKVNLSQPQVVVMLEVLPLVGQQACAVSALPGSLMVTRPKLCIKPTTAAVGSGK